MTENNSNALYVLFSTIALLFLLSCSGQREFTLSQSELNRIEAEMAARSWTIPSHPEQAMRPRTWDLQHQKLWVQFDFEQQQVIGKTELLLTSMRNTNVELVLDSKTTELDSIYVIPGGQLLNFEQDSSTVSINLHRFHARNDSLKIGISFRSTPPARGLYFVNSHLKDTQVPRQVWTLGQPEDNSFWYPTIDHPAERATQEVWISVPDTYQTISNGILVSQTFSPENSLRTDYWRLNQPHSPYLLAIAVGEFSLTERLHNGVLFRYYTEPQFENYVDIIYAHTEAMFDFMEKKTGVAYPWDPVYAQVPVRNFIASGMENTTATFLFDGVQFDERGFQDLSNQDLIMHEVAHQWYGNLVTTRDWANLALNEGFANYFEILFREFMQGHDEAIWANLQHRQDYFREAATMRRPVISARYMEPEDMYDRHTYQKAGQILRMLHHHLGDDMWWAANNAWLTDFAFQAVSVDDLQSVFERETGESLQWFFRQWFHEPGHPTLEIIPEIERNQLSINQLQDIEKQPVFSMLFDIELISPTDTLQKQVFLNTPDSTFVFEIDGLELSDIIVDPDRIQLAEFRNYGTVEQNLDRLRHPSIAVRLGALQFLYENGYENSESVFLEIAENDPFFAVRQRAVEYLANFRTPEIQAFAKTRTFENEPEGQVRLASLYLLHDFESELTENFLLEMTRDTSYFVSAEAMKLFGQYYPDKAYDALSENIEGWSWRHIHRRAVIQGLQYATDCERSFDLIYELASQIGDDYYIRDALIALTQFHNMPGARSAAVDLYLSRIPEEIYSRNRVTMYEAIARLDAKETISTLEFMLKDRNVSTNERNVLKDVINALQNDTP